LLLAALLVVLARGLGLLAGLLAAALLLAGLVLLVLLILLILRVLVRILLVLIHQKILPWGPPRDDNVAAARTFPIASIGDGGEADMTVVSMQPRS
jgi:hypothetical protein